MAPLKRKSNTNSQQDGPYKKQKPTDDKQRRPAVLRDEELAFARGGASILTPLEHKQIQIKAKQDVLFEQETGKRQAPPRLGSDGEDVHGEGDSENVEAESPALSVPTKYSKKKDKPRKTKGKGFSIAEQGPKIEGLSYRRIVPGSLVLGQVSKINRYDITISLPNNLTGYAPLTAISTTLTRQIEHLAADGSDDENNQTDLDLKSLFYVGQFVRAYVTSVGNADGQSQKTKHIELSLRPEEANLGIAAADVPVNTVLQAEVVSVEDHGIVANLGLPSGNVKGFISSKEVDPLMRSTDHLHRGTVMLCMVIGKSSNGKIVKLSADPQKIGNLKKGNFVSETPTIDSLLPGCAVEVLVTEVMPTGLAGKILGVLDVTADIIHSGAAASAKPIEKRYPIGSKTKARVICTFPAADGKKVGVSLLENVVSLSNKRSLEKEDEAEPKERLPISTIVNEARVAKVDPIRGLFLDLGVKGIRGFAHISRISDDKIDVLSESTGQYKVGSVHQCRVIGYNSLDALFLVSLERKVLDLPFLQLEDIKLGQVVEGVIDKLVTKDTTVEGAVVKITDSISGFVPEIHFSDVRLQHPERKFKQGVPVSARVLSRNFESRRMRLTLKKTLVNSDVSAWTSYDELKPGMQAPGTLVNITPSGAVVQFYGNVRAFLPVAQMSESYLSDARQHFRPGQVVNVHIVTVDPAEERMIVSCRDPESFGAAQEIALQSIHAGAQVRGTVSEKTNDEVVIELEDSRLKATMSIEHLVDGSAQKCQSAAKRIRVGQNLHDIVVLGKNDIKRTVRLTSRPSLLKAFNSGEIPKSFEEIALGSKVTGFVRNITPTGIFVQFANDIIGLLLKTQLPEEAAGLDDFGMRRHQTIYATVLSLDAGQQRFLLTQKAISSELKPLIAAQSKVEHATELVDAVDGVSKSMEDFTLGKLTQARIASVKETQLNVHLATGVQGRIDVSEVFDSWESIKNRKRPLASFHSKQIIPVRILGIHDSRNHRFLPITHVGKAPVFELSSKRSTLESIQLDVLTLDKVKEGSDWLCFVNNIAGDCIWVNLSPNVRGRIRAIDLTDDVSLLDDIAKNFPVGSAIRASVTKVDATNSHLDLCARLSSNTGILAIDSLSEGMVLPAKVTKVTERYAMAQLSESLSAPIHLVNLADDYSQADPTSYHKNQIIRVCVLKVDAPNKKILLSARPSKVLSSSLPVVDREISDYSNLQVNDIVRGFIKHVADNGIFVGLGSDIDAFIRVSELSDAFIKDWKAEFEIDKLVKGKVISVNEHLRHVQLSLKQSVIDNEYKAPLAYGDLRIGQIVTGKIRKVEDFGVFIVMDHSSNVSGLCHRSEIADGPVADVRKLYDAGDAVKAKVLKIDLERRRVSLGLKASYLAKDTIDVDESDHDTDIDQASGVSIDQDMDDILNSGAADNDIDMDDLRSDDGEESSGMAFESNGVAIPGTKPLVDESAAGLDAGGFDWAGDIFNDNILNDDMSTSEGEGVEGTRKKKKRRKAEIKIDRTGDLDANGPQSTADFERLLLGQPNESRLWISYMAFYLQLSEISKARDIAERALRTINSQSRDTEQDSLNVWVAYLNLENTYGTDDRVDDVFKRACEFNDAENVHKHLASIYIQSTKYEVSDDAKGLKET